VAKEWRKFRSRRAACKVSDLAPSTYYYRQKGQKELRRLKSDVDLVELIEKIQLKFPAYGYRRIHAELEKAHRITVNEKRIRRVMKKYGLKALIWRGFKIRTTNSLHNHGYAKNEISGKTVTQRNEVWVADITYIRISSSFVYLACVMDLFNRKIVGYALSDHIDTNLCLEALKMAIRNEKPKPGLIHHSDRGVQYACTEYRDILEEHGIIPSMSAKGYCYDNAFMESFFKTLKAEEVYLTEYETIEDVEKNISRFIEEMYNRHRRHSSLGYFSPQEYDRLASKGLLKQMGIPQFVKVSS
jgi:putative transposase